MKSFTILHVLLIVLLMIVYQCSKAQDFLVTAKGDTVTGALKPISFGPEKKVQVTSADKKKSLYSIFQIKSYNYKGETYHPVKNDKGYTFMKLVKPGYLSLYSFQIEGQTTYDGLYLAKRDGSGMEVPNLSFKKMMERFLEDCPVVAAKIDNGELGKREINQIVDEYNGCIQNRTVNHGAVIATNQLKEKKSEPWEVLEAKVKEQPDFEGKQDAMEMIGEIRTKIKRGEKVPNFLVEGLKTSLSQTDLSSELETALAELNK
jgi:hypothetical protein